MELSLWQKIKLKICGEAYAGLEMREGWSEPNKIYAVKCPAHGLYFGTRHGWGNKTPQCSKCMEELAKKVLLLDQ